MVNGNVTEVSLHLLSPTTLTYSDNRHVGEELREDIDIDSLRRDTTDWIIESLYEKVDFCNDEGLRILGRHLYQKIFPGPIGKMFDETYGYFEDAANQAEPCTLRIVITFHPEAEDLASLPWEFLYYAKGSRGGTFLSGGRHQLVLTRMVENQEELKYEPGTPKVLAAVCTPEDLRSGITRESVQKIAAASTSGEADAASRDSNTKVLGYLKKLALGRRIHLEILSDPEFTELQKAAEGNPSIIHFIGHGAPGKLILRRSAELVNRDMADYYRAQSAGQRPKKVAEHEQVDVSKVETLFRQRRPKLVFLQACYGASVGRGVEFSTALEIVKVGVPAVVAMQYNIDAGPADEFALAFYKRLMNGGTIADAVSDGRQTLATQGEGKAWAHRNFGTPVIYMRGDAVVVESATQGQMTTAQEVAKAPLAMQQRTCKRCHREHCKYRSCPTCRLHFFCQCAKDPERDCQCDVELEEPQNGWCGLCEHETEQPSWRQEPAIQLGGPVAGAAPAGLRAVARAEDNFEAAS